jgi:hypothetical protein
MATSMMDKSLYAAPQGLNEMGDESAIEIEIENPEGVKIGIDGIEIDLMPEEDSSGAAFDDNLAEFIDDSELGTIGSDIMALVEADISGRKDWT